MGVEHDRRWVSGREALWPSRRRFDGDLGCWTTQLNSCSERSESSEPNSQPVEARPQAVGKTSACSVLSEECALRVCCCAHPTTTPCKTEVVENLLSRRQACTQLAVFSLKRQTP